MTKSQTTPYVGPRPFEPGENLYGRDWEVAIRFFPDGKPLCSFRVPGRVMVRTETVADPWASFSSPSPAEHG